MKKLIFGLSVIFLASCGGSDDKKSGNMYADFTISMDTVMVDSGNEILMAATNGYGHAINPGFDRLYFWDSKSSKIEVVDLDEFKIVEKIPVEKEGPDGVGQNAYMIKYVGKDQLIFIGWGESMAVTDLRGKVLNKIKMDEPWMIEGLEERASLSLMEFSLDGKTVYSSIANFQKLDSDIYELDLENETRRKIELPEYEKREKYRVSWKSDDGMAMSMTFPGLNMVNWQDKVLFYTTSLNSIYQYDSEKDSLSIHQYENVLTASEKTGTYKNEVSSQEEMQKVSAQIREEVNFTKMLWDEKNEVFYRFASFALPKMGDEELRYRSFISILNPSFELIGEKEITDLGIRVPNPQFVKDGKIHLYLNLDDELAYQRLSID